MHLAEKGLKVARGTIVDATIINVPSSTKNQHGVRDPEMHQTKKGSQWYFGLKAHIGVDSDNKLVHSADVMAANVHYSQVLADLLHGEETRVWGDSAYIGQDEVLAEHAPQAQDFTHARARRNAPLTEEDQRITASGLVREIIRGSLKNAERDELVRKHGFKPIDHDGETI